MSREEPQLDHPGPAGHHPSLTSAACPAPALLAASGFQVPDSAAQAPAEFLSYAPSPLQKLLPNAVDASPKRSENAGIADQMLRSYCHSPNPFSLDGTKMMITVCYVSDIF